MLMEKVFFSKSGGTKRDNACTMRLGTREKWLRGKHNPSGDILQLWDRFCEVANFKRWLSPPN
jgi:hypothetical protein